MVQFKNVVSSTWLSRDPLSYNMIEAYNLAPTESDIMLYNLAPTESDIMLYKNPITVNHDQGGLWLWYET
jgi:hypothetical protein